jgi:outer membrane immunogenic protein
MKRLGIATFGLVSAMALGAAMPANAADVYRPEPSLKDGPAEYVPSITWTGFYIGGHLGAAWDDSEDVEIVDDAVFAAGLHAGYNWQGPSNIVLGIEGDVSFMDDVEYLSTIRGRLGYSFGPTLAYITGGAAFIGFDDEFFSDDSDTGWVAGAGFEHKLRENVSFGLEGLYYDFENDDFGDSAFYVGRARLTYHLNGGREQLR